MDVAVASLVPNRKRKEIFCHVSGRERSSSSHHLRIQKRYEKAYQTFSRLIFSLSSWLSLILPAPMGWTTKRQTIIAVSCRLFPFHPGSQSPPAIWCPTEISTIIYRMGVCFFGRKKDVWSACCRRGLYTMIHRPWYTASLPVPAARQLVDVQQAQCFRSASHYCRWGGQPYHACSLHLLTARSLTKWEDHLGKFPATWRTMARASLLLLCLPFFPSTVQIRQQRDM